MTNVRLDAAMSSRMACLHGDEANCTADCCGSSSTACRFLRNMSRRRTRTQKSHTDRDIEQRGSQLATTALLKLAALGYLLLPEFAHANHKVGKRGGGTHQSAPVGPCV
eukprot:scaffold49748_cov66-Phaeocystis_antarctica.AAC.3